MDSGTKLMIIECLFIYIAAGMYAVPINKRKSTAIGISLIMTLFSIIIGVVFIVLLNDTLLNEYLKTFAAIVMLSFLFHIYSESGIKESVYLSIWSVITSQFIFQIWRIAGRIADLNQMDWVGAKVTLIAVYGIFYLIIFFFVARKMPRDGFYDVGPRQFTSAVVLLFVFEILYFSIMRSEFKGTDSEVWIPVVLAQFYCLSMLYLQTELFKKSAIEHELSTMNLLWQQQKSQYNLAKENIDFINRKCHDLKHQIRAIQELSDKDRINSYLKEVEKSTQIYDCIVKTGNEVLDTILTEKSLYCEHNGIHIHNIVDGSRMSFIDPVDLYTILGNAIDNAIEGVKNFSEEDKRIIDINIYTKQQFLAIIISNPIWHSIRFKDGLPVTTKVKNGYHGYGLKSIKYYVQKYSGNMNITIHNECFVLKVIIPLNEIQ